jgi:Associated with zinc fingers
MEEEGGAWQTPKRKKVALQSKVQGPGRNTRNIDENPFSPLAGTSQEAHGETQGETKEERPPPIFIKNLTNINALLAQLRNLNPGEFHHSCNQSQLKLNFKTIEGYRSAISYLASTTAEYHTFQLKSERAFRVVFRGLHPTCDTDLMMEELRQLGFLPIQMLPVRHPVTKQLLPMFFVDFKPSAKNSELYNLKRLYHAVIKVEPPKPRRTVIQCSRCQEYNHTKNFCHKKERCVKCDGMHASSSCPKSPESPPVCVNCKGAHTANYRGCPVHRTLQQAHPQLRQLNRRRIEDHQTHEPTPTQPSSKQQGRSYADAVRTQNTPQTSDTNLLQKIDSLISLIQPLIGMLTQILPALLKK